MNVRSTAPTAAERLLSAFEGAMGIPLPVHVCRKLGLQSGMRLLGVGCGWGSMAIHAAEKYDVSVVGITLSHEQAEWARARTWLLYLAASALGFEEKGRLTIHQVLAVRPSDTGSSGRPRTLALWLG
ncbi:MULTISPECIES: class I SAM-dependent methyltransferase [Rhodococcus]|uniref:class I SAM-dependent methyltransferase n=1 Tax=Rhodococcus TaxID=1827 RepID=UPI0023DF59E1|nr:MULTISPECIES: class I SAM-dependent methyltransferase [Rhodococcus]